MRANKENLPNKTNSCRMIKPKLVVSFTRLFGELEKSLGNSRRSGKEVALERTGLNVRVVERMGRGVLSGHNAKKILSAYNRMTRAAS
jgi:hypothetical protein